MTGIIHKRARDAQLRATGQSVLSGDRASTRCQFSHGTAVSVHCAVRRRGHGAQSAAFPCLVCLAAQF